MCDSAIDLAVIDQAIELYRVQFEKTRVLLVVNTKKGSPSAFEYPYRSIITTSARIESGVPRPGAEFISRDFDMWAYARVVTLDFSRPGKPIDSAFAEVFNSRVRAERMNPHWFLTLADVREKMEA